MFSSKNGRKANNPKDANKHSHCISCKSASFLIYDKIAQLEMIERLDESLVGKHILRFEAELKRPALKKHLGKQAMETNYKLLSTAVQKTQKVIRWYLDRMQPQCKKYLRYEDAADLIDNAKFKRKIKDRMLYLLRRTSDKEALISALYDLQIRYHLTDSQCKTILRKF